MVGTGVMKALVGALLIMMLASISGGFATATTAEAGGTGSTSCGVDFAAMLESAVNSAMYTLIKLNVSANSTSWSLVIEANASVEAIAEAQATGQCSTALGLYLNATKKISLALSEARKESAESAELLKEQAGLTAEIRAEIKAALRLRAEIREAFEQGRINASLEASLEAEVNASIEALTQLEARVNASIEAGNLTVQAIQEFRAELKQIREGLRTVSMELHEAIANSYKEEIEARVKSKLKEAMMKLQELEQKLQERGVCADLPDLCAAINQSIGRLMNITVIINQSAEGNMSAFAAMVMAAHAEGAAEGLMKAVGNMSVEVNASIEVHQAYANASAKLDELKQALIDLRDAMAARFMPTQQVNMMIQGVGELKEELRMSVNHCHRRHWGEGSTIRDTTQFFSSVRSYMVQLNASAGIDQELRAKIDAVITKLGEAEVAVNATINITINASATFNETCMSKAEALLTKSLRTTRSAGEVLQALGMEGQASAVEQATAKLEAAIEAVESGDNATAVQDIDAAVTILTDVQSQISGSGPVYVSINARISISIELALSAKAELQ